MTGVLTTIVLYCASYLSLLRLLRYPRNWEPATASAVAAPIAFTALTIVHTAWSPAGIDWVVLAVVCGFVAALFCVIAAPGIAFRPVATGFDALAKHSEHAGLWMLLPAAAIAAVMRDEKVSALLGTACAIEIQWYVRHRLNDRRAHLWPIEDDDLEVLRTQASGDLEGYARRHRIKELVIADDVQWRGCTRTTLPCPFNYYVNRLGMNSAPCCREHLRELFAVVAGWLEELRVDYWLEGGSLLGAVREGGRLIPWEDDIDLSILLEHADAWHQIVSALRERARSADFHLELFPHTGVIAVSFDPRRPWPWRWERARWRGELRVDIAGYRRATSHGEPVIERRTPKGKFPRTESGGYGVSGDLVLPTSRIPFLGGQYACPRDSEAYLTALYGDFRRVEYMYIEPAVTSARRGIDERKP